jgi:hypothetical protein
VRLEGRAPVRILVARRVHNPIRRVNLLEHTVFEIQLVGGGPEQDAPRPAHPQVGLGLDDDPALVRGVPTAPRLGVDPVRERAMHAHAANQLLQLIHVPDADPQAAQVTLTPRSDAKRAKRSPDGCGADATAP